METHGKVSRQWTAVRMFKEHKCVQCVAKSANKADGVGVLCETLGISFQEIAFCGHDKEDQELLTRCYALHTTEGE